MVRLNKMYFEDIDRPSEFGLVTGGMHTWGKHMEICAFGYFPTRKHAQLHIQCATLGYLHIRGFAHSVSCTLGALHTELCTLLREQTNISFTILLGTGLNIPLYYDANFC